MKYTTISIEATAVAISTNEVIRLLAVMDSLNHAVREAQKDGQDAIFIGNLRLDTTEVIKALKVLQDTGFKYYMAQPFSEDETE